MNPFYQDSLELANSLGVSLECATDVLYLRTRSRWSLALEEELIRLHSLGQAPNICEFGVTRETQSALLQQATGS